MPKEQAPANAVALGCPIDAVDCEGHALHIGDVLDFDSDEYGQPCRFTITMQRGEVCHPGSARDLESWCTLVRRWDGSEP